MHTPSRLSILGFGFLIITFSLMACTSAPEVIVSIQVNDQTTEQGIDSVSVVLYRIFDPEKTDRLVIDTVWTNEEGKAGFQFEYAAGYIYRLEAEKQFYQEALPPEGGMFLNQVELSDADTQEYTLWLEQILAPEPDRFVKMHSDVSIQDVIHTLKTDEWEWAFLPRMQWGDISALLTISGDTNYVHAYPHHPKTTYRPDSVRVGLVALWLIEAIRRQNIRQQEFAYLMPPSRAPVLGTRRGNPSGYNSPRQIQIASEAYDAWWQQSVTAGDTIKSARKNPLRGKGMSWM